jgi:hypothetical protein
VSLDGLYQPHTKESVQHVRKRKHPKTNPKTNRQKAMRKKPANFAAVDKSADTTTHAQQLGSCSGDVAKLEVEIATMVDVCGDPKTQTRFSRVLHPLFRKKAIKLLKRKGNDDPSEKQIAKKVKRLEAKAAVARNCGEPNTEVSVHHRLPSTTTNAAKDPGRVGKRGTEEAVQLTACVSGSVGYNSSAINGTYVWDGSEQNGHKLFVKRKGFGSGTRSLHVHTSNAGGKHAWWFFGEVCNKIINNATSGTYLGVRECPSHPRFVKKWLVWKGDDGYKEEPLVVI